VKGRASTESVRFEAPKGVRPTEDGSGQGAEPHPENFFFYFLVNWPFFVQNFFVFKVRGHRPVPPP